MNRKIMRLLFIVSLLLVLGNAFCMESNEFHFIKEYKIDMPRAFFASISKDGNYIAVTSPMEKFMVFKGSQKVFTAHQQSSMDLTIDLSSFGRYVVGNTYRGKVVVYDTQRNVIIFNNEREIGLFPCVQLSADGTRVAFSNFDGDSKKKKIIVLGIGSSQKPQEICTYEVESISPINFILSANGRYIAFKYLGSVIVLDVKKKEAVLKISVENWSCFCLSSDGTCVAISTEDGNVLVHNRITGGQKECRLAIPQPQGIVLPSCRTKVLKIFASADGRYVASGCTDGTVLLADIEKKKVVCQYTHANPALDICFTGDGKRIVSVSCEGIVKVHATSKAFQISHYKEEKKREQQERLEFLKKTSKLEDIVFQEQI